ncbi:MAG: hypothetical protein ACFFD6_10565 [Candidatus Thorarchaeota archaeon]
MRKYDSSLGTSLLAPVIVAIIIVAGFAAAMVWFPGGIGPTTTTTTTTTTPTTGDRQGYGPLAADYLNSRREDVVFYWMCNSTFVNEDLSAFYDGQHAGAFVDGVQMWRNDTDYCRIEVLFAPWSNDIVGSNWLNPDDWFSLSGSLIDDGVGQMADASTHPTDFPHTWPVDFWVEVFFEDLSMFYIGYTSSDGYVYLANGTWTGSYTEWGWPEVSGYNPGVWLLEGGYLVTPIANFYTAITTTVSYP